MIIPSISSQPSKYAKMQLNLSSPQFGRTTDHREEHSVQIKVLKGPSDGSTIECKCNDRYGEIQSTADDVTFPDEWLSCMG
jgi:hypothetical protein